MTPPAGPVDAPAILDIEDVSKEYGALRPLRVKTLRVAAGESIAVVGLDQIAAEMAVNLITGATLPTAGRIRVFGRDTADILDATDWLATVDRFGIVSDRAALLDVLTPLQNLAMPFTLDVEPLAAETRDRAESLAREAGLDAEIWGTAIGALDAAASARVRFGRALALEPAILLLDHASARLHPGQASAFARTIRSAAARRGLATLALTADTDFARAVADRVLRWEPASGRLRDR
ncbi:MAG TPA: ATP-binding cassette domain-containing protein [Vicinamibacterales bacterium]